MYKNNKRKWIVGLSSAPLLVTIAEAIFWWINYDYSLSPTMSEITQLKVAFSGAILFAAILFTNEKIVNWLNTFWDDEEDATDEDIVTVTDIFSVVIVFSIVVGIFIFLWKTIWTESSDSVNYIDIQKSEQQVENVEQSKVEYTDEGWIYHSKNGKTVGPFQYIFEEDWEFFLDDIARYIDEGLYGYVHRNGEIVTEAVFLNATKFEDGTAKVAMNKDHIFYIDEKGNRMTKDYLAGSDTYEMQGQYCRVKTAYDTWAIIDRDDNMIFSGDSIEKLPIVTTLGSAVVNGHAVLFQLNSLDGKEFKIIKEYEEFNKISEVFLDAFAFVWTEDDYMGVIDSAGELIVQPNYISVEHKFIKENDEADYTDFNLNNILFLATDQEGMIHVIKAGNKV